MAKTHVPARSFEASNNNTAGLIYNLIFCDDIELYKEFVSDPDIYPWNVLLSENANTADLLKIIDETNTETRIKILAYNKLLAHGYRVDKKELLAVIIEAGLEDGLDVLASFRDGTARYINQSGKMIIWETTDKISDTLTKQLFTSSENIVKQIGPWNRPRRAEPPKGILRITFLVSDGLYFGEGPIDILHNDTLARPALMYATELVKYLTDKVLLKK